MIQSKSFLLFALSLLVAFIFGAAEVQACTCRATPNVLDSFEKSDQVVVVKALSVERADSERRRPGGIKSTRMLVEKVYKGTLKAGEEITFGQGGGADCVWTFKEESIGERFLFYLANDSKKSNLWFAGTCGRSNAVENISDDFLFLDNLDKVLGKTRISGRIACAEDDCGGRKVKIIGSDKKVSEVVTDKNGIYEIYDLPAGEYLIEPEITAGWKVDNYFLRSSNDYLGEKLFPDDTPRTQFPILLREKKHALLDFAFRIDNAVSGRLFDPNGKPMKDICVSAVRVEVKKGNYNGETDCTDADGEFKIEGLYSNNYRLVINPDGIIDSNEPFGTLFYPGVSEYEKAGIISIDAGKFIDDINFRIPAFEDVITVTGRLLYADGKPLVDKLVIFEPANSVGKPVELFRAHTDKAGNFSMRILRGLEGRLYSIESFYKRQYEKCPEISKTFKLKESFPGTLIKTGILKIKAEKDLSEVELKFPVPSCQTSR